jgi:hypothetical protein
MAIYGLQKTTLHTKCRPVKMDYVATIVDTDITEQPSDETNK